MLPTGNRVLCQPQWNWWLQSGSPLAYLATSAASRQRQPFLWCRANVLKLSYSVRPLAPCCVGIAAPSPFWESHCKGPSKRAGVFPEGKWRISALGHAFLMGLYWYEKRVSAAGHTWSCEGGSITELNKTLWRWPWDFLQRQCRHTLSSWRPVLNAWGQIPSKSIWLFVAVLKCCRKVCILSLQFSKVIKVL